jgi:sugar-specific transcriptional regulator TrmB/DNA-binding CsgD family transcriptional regulator
VNSLRALGLGADDERLYREVLASPGADADTLADKLGVSRAQLDVTLSHLASLGLTSAMGEAQQVYPVAPKSALHLLELRRRQELLEREEALDHAHLEAERLAEDYDAGSARTSIEIVETIHGEAAVASQYEAMQRAAREEVLVFDRPPYTITSAENHIQQEVLDRGVVYRTVYDTSSLSMPGQPEELLRCIAAGEQARIIAGVPLKLVIVDRKAALVPLNIGQPALFGSLFVHESSVLDALLMLFDLLWEKAAPYGETPPAEAELGAFDRQMLLLMASGFNDQRLARQLGVSPRTLARRITRLTDALGAESRFQAGVAAVRRGWL